MYWVLGIFASENPHPSTLFPNRSALTIKSTCIHCFMKACTDRGYYLQIYSLQAIVHGYLGLCVREREIER